MKVRCECWGCQRVSDVLAMGERPRGWFAVTVLRYSLKLTNYACSGDCVETVKQKSIEYVCSQAREHVSVERVK